MNPRGSRYYTYIQPVFRNKNVQLYGPLIFGLIVIIFFLIFAVRPTVSTIISLQKTISEREKVLETANTKSEDLSEARDNYNNLDGNTKSKVYALIPTSASLPCFISYINNLATENDASLSAIQIDQTMIEGTSDCVINDQDLSIKESGTLSEVKFTLTVSGNFTSLVNFLKQIKNLNRLIMIDTTTINENSADKSLFMAISGRIFYLGSNTTETKTKEAGEQ